MKKGTKNLLMYGLLGGVIWIWWQGRYRRLQHAEAVVKNSQQVLPTDSMMPGSLEAAANGIIKEGNGLSFLGR